MKRICLAVFSAVVALVVTFAIDSCEMYGSEDPQNGEIRLFFSSASGGEVRSVSELPDTSDFMLSVRSSDGNLIYEGLYGACPERLKVSPGSYTVTVVSEYFDRPTFSRPQYGDEQCVLVNGGGVVNVTLLCRQMNSGVRLKIDPAFLAAYPDGVLFLKSQQGRLMYSYSEKRVAYFKPGLVSLILSTSGKEEVIMTRELSAQEILSLSVKVSAAQTGASETDGGMSIVLDTARNWIGEKLVIGEAGNSGNTPQTAYNVTQARAAAPMKDVWVSGYIVGGDLTTTSGAFEEPFRSRTNLILGPRSSTVDREVCLAVQLPSGSIRDALNLVDNPSLLGTKVCLKGNIVESYFGIAGLKEPDDYVL